MFFSLLFLIHFFEILRLLQSIECGLLWLKNQLLSGYCYKFHIIRRFIKFYVKKWNKRFTFQFLQLLNQFGYKIQKTNSIVNRILRFKKTGHGWNGYTYINIVDNFVHSTPRIAPVTSKTFSYCTFYPIYSIDISLFISTNTPWII